MLTIWILDGGGSWLTANCCTGGVSGGVSSGGVTSGTGFCRSGGVGLSCGRSGTLQGRPLRQEKVNVFVVGETHGLAVKGLLSGKGAPAALVGWPVRSGSQNEFAAVPLNV